MRNLRVSGALAARLPGGAAQALCCGPGAVYACGPDPAGLALTKYSSGEAAWRRTLAAGAGTVLDVTYLQLPQETCAGLASGDIYTVHTDNTHCELVATCSDGLLAMQWSPDQELLVLVSKTNNMILMSYTYDSITEVNLADEEFGEKGFITVGWGKKETQFHGSEGKQAARATVEIAADDRSIIDQTPRITWRGDGQLYAVGILINGIRRFKVFDRDGRLQYTSEKQPGLEANLAWRPSGNVIATTQKLPNKYVVAFFEKNGLKHGDFTIPVNPTTFVEELLWNYDSDILALKCYDSAVNKHSILLFTSSNYHWYLKQTLRYEHKIIKVFWDNDFDVASGKKLHVFLSDEMHYEYSWNWTIDHSVGKDSNDDAIVAVIDANKLLLSSFRHTVIPPPMSAFQVETKSNVNFVAFGPAKTNENCIWDSNSVCVGTENNELSFYKQTNKVPLQYELAGVVNLEDTVGPLHNYNWIWLNHDTLTCIKHANESYFIQEYGLTNGENIQLKLNNSLQLESPILACSPHPNENSKIFLEATDGVLLEYTVGGDLIPSDMFFPQPCPKFTVVCIYGDLYFLGLTYKNHLCVNGDYVMNNVSSLFVHSHFLLLTTLQHELLCTELTKDGLIAIMEYQKKPSSQITKRKVERGSKLVVVVPNDTRTVFQLPRGNLETIQPRPLSLKIIGEYLDVQKYYAAFDLMRKQRINLNLIHDHNPQLLLENIGTFLKEINNNSWLSLFLTDLENIDVTKTMYASSYAHKDGSINGDVNSKVVTVCDAVRSYLESIPDRDERILPILTSYVKKNTIADLESALYVVKELKTKEQSGFKIPITSEEALKYLLYLVDVNYLFDIALGMYDFDLVLLVANKSQKDPKEYVPMLNEFNEMENNFKRFSINKHLKRFGKAVECLAECGPSRYEELTTFVKYHSLYRDALKLFKPSDEIYKQIADDYGLHLKLKKQFVEAGVIYQRGNNTDKAVECFKEALEWNLAIKLAYSWPKEQFRELCWDLVSALKKEKRHSEALVVLEQYCDNKEETISYAVKCVHYSTALRLCNEEEQEKRILEALSGESISLNWVIAGNAELFAKHRERLAVVRTNKSNVAKGDAFDTSYMQKDSDLYSDAGSTVASNASKSSGRTFRSSKNRRKHERKMISLKEGSQYEDVALVTALHKLVHATFDLRSSVKEVNLGLCWFGQCEEAMTLQSHLDKLLKEMKDHFKEIWTHEFALEAANASIAALNVPEGGSTVPQGIAALDARLRIAPIIQDIHWKLEGL